MNPLYSLIPIIICILVILAVRIRKNITERRIEDALKAERDLIYFRKHLCNEYYGQTAPLKESGFAHNDKHYFPFLKPISTNHHSYIPFYRNLLIYQNTSLLTQSTKPY